MTNSYSLLVRAGATGVREDDVYFYTGPQYGIHVYLTDGFWKLWQSWFENQCRGVRGFKIYGWWPREALPVGF